MNFDGIIYPWLHLWMLSAVPLVTFAAGALSWKVLGRWTWVLIAGGIVLVLMVKIAGG
jgi:hypothetical protein